ncbi:MAG: SAM-dependent methyltransferase [Treponema sp.]|jgi:23S rRNA (cytidine2498-2'-O)-methyltransferase|nr:SAM-dependent methyltransferase [Treponema sp.]
MSVNIEKTTGSAYLAFPEMISELEKEFLNRKICTKEQFEKRILYGELIYFPTLTMDKVPFWCKSAMYDLFIMKFDSITDAVHGLCDIQRNWSPAFFTHFRRGMLIQEKMPYVNLKIRSFPCTIPQSPIGMYTLLDEHTILASAKTTDFLPSGHIELEEDHENPPSRAYLKLQEALIRMPYLFPEHDIELPKNGTKCLDVGASPGGWTWVLRRFCCNITSVDRAELSPRLMADRYINFIKHDVFSLTPEDLGEFEWIFSDIICYPERLYEWVQMWRKSEKFSKMICTIKLQGEENWEIIERFAAIPNSRVLHLNYNKHEFTFFHINK